jgi:hypothetical protein
MRVFEFFFVGAERVEALVLDLHQTQPFEIRIGGAPCAALVAPRAVGKHVAHRPFGVDEGRSFKLRVRKPLGETVGAVLIETQSALQRTSENVVLDPVRTRFPQCRNHGGAQERHENEVVEMARLQSRILAVVCEPEDLALDCLDGGPLAMHPLEDRRHQDGGRGAPAFGAQAGQPIHVGTLAHRQFAAVAQNRKWSG